MTDASQFDFDTVVPRRGSGCFKWDSNPSDHTLPMFVADMDFKVPEVVLEALRQRVDHGVFGYTWVPEAYYAAVAGWSERRYGFALEHDWILPSIGIVPAISAILRALIQPGDGVIVQSPVYHCFFSSVERIGGRIVENKLVMTDSLDVASTGTYQVDWDDLEQKAAAPDVKVMLLCHPHNPSGRVWRDDELLRLGEICQRHNVTVVSDEIHCDLLFPGEAHRPFASLSPDHLANCITLTAPGKTFNLAGLQIGNAVIADRALRVRVLKALREHEINGVNPFGVAGSIAAYTHGADWLDALNAYLYRNFQHIQTFLQQELPQLKLYPQQSTYLAWIDCSATGLSGTELAKRLLDEGELRISSGSGFLPGQQENRFIRLNFACSRSTLEDGLERLKQVLQSF